MDDAKQYLDAERMVTILLSSVIKETSSEAERIVAEAVKGILIDSLAKANKAIARSRALDNAWGNVHHIFGKLQKAIIANPKDPAVSSLLRAVDELLMMTLRVN